MSDKAVIPQPHVLYPRDNGFSRCRAVLTTLTVTRFPRDARRITVTDDDHTTVFDLNAEQARALAGLLLPREGA